MKLLLWTTGILLTLALAVAWFMREGSSILFERQVYPDWTVAHGLKTGQASCMHCPWYYRFDTSPEVIQQIIVQRAQQRVRLAFSSVGKRSPSVCAPPKPKIPEAPHQC